MKSILLSALLCSFLFLSCSTDDTIVTETGNVATSNKNKMYARSSDNVPNSTANAYDTTGNIQYQILLNVVDNAPANTLSSIVTTTNAVALANTGFTALAPAFTGITTAQVQWVIDCNGNSQTVVNNSGTSAAGKAQLTLFLGLMDGAETNEYSDNYDIITDFEDKINTATNLTATDKVLILRTTSIARYLCYYVDDKDRDWHGIKSALFGAIKGGNTNVETAITLAVACGIQQNFNE